MPIYFILGGNYFNYAVKHAIFMRQHIMEASHGSVDFFLTKPNVEKMMAFGFEYPMSGSNCAQFADDGNGQINDDVRNYIELTYNSSKKNYDISIDWSTVGLALRFSLIMASKNRFSMVKQTVFETGIRKYYNDSAVLICRPIAANGLVASFKLLGGGTDMSGGHNHDGNNFYCFFNLF